MTPDCRTSQRSFSARPFSRNVNTRWMLITRCESASEGFTIQPMYVDSHSYLLLPILIRFALHLNLGPFTLMQVSDNTRPQDLQPKGHEYDAIRTGVSNSPYCPGLSSPQHQGMDLAAHIVLCCRLCSLIPHKSGSVQSTKPHRVIIRRCHRYPWPRVL